MHWTHPSFALPTGPGQRQRPGTSRMDIEPTPALSDFGFLAPAMTDGRITASLTSSTPIYREEQGPNPMEFSDPRPLQPLNTLTAAFSSPLPQAEQRLLAKIRRWQPPDADWDKHKDLIHDLYITRNQTLVQTMKHMEQQHRFFASYVSALSLPKFDCLLLRSTDSF